jgi:hypothetical protein
MRVKSDREEMEEIARVRDLRSEQDRALSEKKRLETSASTRRENAENHWSRKWLAKAHRHHPDFKAERLALAARKLLVADKAKSSQRFKKKRAEINEYRADSFLKGANERSK